MVMVMGVLKRCLHQVRRALFNARVASREDRGYRMGVVGLGKVVVGLGMVAPPMGIRSVVGI